MAYKIISCCAGCRLCAKSCPTGAISGNLKEIHTIDPEKCIDCGLCGKLCAFGAIRSEYGQETVKVPKTDWKKPPFDESVCVGCSVCVENCPKNCLEIEAPKFHGDINTIARLARPEDCIDCRICAKVCPIDAVKF